MWLASWVGNAGAAVDFAVSSGLRSDRIAPAAADPSVVWRQYEDFKKGYLNTEADCNRQGFSFLPFVVEAHGGGLGPIARQVVARLAKARAAREGESVETSAADLLRRISTSVHREVARAVLRRLPTPAAAPPAPQPEAWGDAMEWQ